MRKRERERVMAALKVVLFSSEMGLGTTEEGGDAHLKQTRLSSLCDGKIPECLLPVGGKPLIYHQLSLLRAVGLEDVIIVTHEWSLPSIRTFVDLHFGDQKKKEEGSGKEEQNEKENTRLNVEVVAVPRHYYATDALREIRGKIQNDFIILNWDVLLDPSLLHSLVDLHRTHSSLLSCLFIRPQQTVAQQLKEKEAEKKKAAQQQQQKKRQQQQQQWSFDQLKMPFMSVTTPVSHYIGLDRHRLLVAVPSEASVGDDFGSLRVPVSKVMLRRFPNLTIYHRLVDSIVYICGHRVLDFIDSENEKLTQRTFQTELLPQIVKRQFTSPSFHKSGLGTITDTDAFLQDILHHEKTGEDLGDQKGVKCFARVVGRNTDGYIGQVKTIQDLVDINRDFAHLSSTFFRPVGSLTEQKTFIGENVVLGTKVQIGAESVVGDETEVGDDVTIRRSVIGSNCRIGSKVKIINSLVMDGVVLEGQKTSITNCIITEPHTQKEPSNFLKEC
mmetsp:Transcript_26259/g.36531  ORF Transcript_26259/g.36531 Transcript_26259/m.36531 type:complete len:500 (+) Transcript_26259:350-1849(+)